MSIAYFLSHNGLGDNISNISAVRYLLDGYYNEIYFICKDINLNNLEKIYNSSRVHFIPINHSNEMDEFKRVLTPIYPIDNIDILVSGFCLTPHFKLKITNKKLLERRKIQCYRIQPRCDFIRTMYEDIFLDLSIYYNYFIIESTPKSLVLYDNIKHYNVVFIHTKSSDILIDLTDNFQHLMYVGNNLVICADHNVYQAVDEQYKIVDKYVNKPINEYIDIIMNATYIYVIDSSFSSIIVPLMNMGKLKAIDCHIFDRHNKAQIDIGF